MPSLFPHLPKYLYVATRIEKSGNATPTARIKSAEAQLDERIHEFWAADIPGVPEIGVGIF